MNNWLQKVHFGACPWTGCRVYISSGEWHSNVFGRMPVRGVGLSQVSKDTLGRKQWAEPPGTREVRGPLDTWASQHPRLRIASSPPQMVRETVHGAVLPESGVLGTKGKRWRRMREGCVEPGPQKENESPPLPKLAVTALSFPSAWGMTFAIKMEEIVLMSLRDLIVEGTITWIKNND